MQRPCKATADEQTAYHEGRLAALREQRDGQGYSCPYKRGDRRRAWLRGLANGRDQIRTQSHQTAVDSVPQHERDANKAAMAGKIEAWLAQQNLL